MLCCFFHKRYYNVLSRSTAEIFPIDLCHGIYIYFLAITPFELRFDLTHIFHYIFSRKKNESQDTDLKDAVNVSMPLIQAAIRDVEKGQFPKSCFLNIGIPASPSTNKVSTL